MEIKAPLQRISFKYQLGRLQEQSKEVQGCIQRTHPRVMGSSKLMEAH